MLQIRNKNRIYMKNLSDIINESKNPTKWKTGVEGSTTFSIGTDMLNCVFDGNKKFGFLRYNADNKIVSLLATDSEESLAVSLSLEENDEKFFEEILSLGVGGQYKDNNTYVMRIW